nr:uncharacterized protein LOC113809523 [Penaeus vannamei]
MVELHMVTRFLQMKNSSNPEVKKYAYRLAKSDGSFDTLLGMGCMVLLEKSSLNVLEELLKGYPEDFSQNLGDLLIEAFRIILDFWRGSELQIGIDYDEVCEYDMMAVFEHILTKFQYITKMEETLSLMRNSYTNYGF